MATRIVQSQYELSSTGQCCSNPVCCQVPLQANKFLGLNVTQPLLEATGQVRWALNNIVQTKAPPCKALLEDVQYDNDWVTQHLVRPGFYGDIYNGTQVAPSFSCFPLLLYMLFFLLHVRSSTKNNLSDYSLENQWPGASHLLALPNQACCTAANNTNSFDSALFSLLVCAVTIVFILMSSPAAWFVCLVKLAHHPLSMQPK